MRPRAVAIGFLAWIVSSAAVQAYDLPRFPQMEVFRPSVGTFLKTVKWKDGLVVRTRTTARYFESNLQFHISQSTYYGNQSESHVHWVITYDPKQGSYLASNFSSAVTTPRPLVYKGTWNADTKTLDLESDGDHPRPKRTTIRFDFGEETED